MGRSNWLPVKISTRSDGPAALENFDSSGPNTSDNLMPGESPMNGPINHRARPAAVYVAVVGNAVCDTSTWSLAEETGRRVALGGGILVCGGRGGVMEAAAKGAATAGGLVVGILPGEDRQEANPHLTVTLPTGLGSARNALVARCADAMIAVGGGFGTLSEIALALKMGIPVIGLHTWKITPGHPARPGAPTVDKDDRRDDTGDDPIVRAGTPEEAVDKAFRLAAARTKHIR